jgi:glycine dehydrogenase subunit 2
LAVQALAARSDPEAQAAFKAAPVTAPRRRLDETLAARRPRLTWTPPQPNAAAAE